MPLRGKRARRRTAAARARPSARVRRRRALLGGALGVLAVVALLFAFGYPVSTLFSQRGQISAAQQHLEQLQRETAALQHQAKQLQGSNAVEQIARQQYGLVRPGETPYVLVPVAPSTTVPTSPPTTVP
jgi:cell division protein DivIC